MADPTSVQVRFFLKRNGDGTFSPVIDQTDPIDKKITLELTEYEDGVQPDSPEANQSLMDKS